MPYEKKNPSVGGGYAGKQRERMKQSFPKVLREPSEPKKPINPLKKNDARNKNEIAAMRGGQTSW